MSPLADMPAVTRHFPTLERPGQSSYTLGLLAACVVHAAVIFGWPAARVKMESVVFDVEAADSSVEVSLVAALPTEEPVVQPPPPEPPPVEVPPEPMPQPPPIPEKPPEMTIPEPAPAPKPPPPQLKPKPRPPKPAGVARPTGDGSSAIPGPDATTAKVSAGAVGVKPGYLRNPHPSYPEAARAAGQQGTVTLFVRVDEAGRVASVRVSRSSGFASLDERARSTVAGRWAFKPAKAGGVPVASDVIIPIRFTLNR